MWLYWFLTTAFQVGQQWLINLEIGKLAPVVTEPQPEADGPEEEKEESDEG